MSVSAQNQATPASAVTPGKHLNKVVKSVDDALRDVSDGATIMVGGFGLCGNAEALIAGIADKKVRGLTLISNNAGNLGKGLAVWLKNGQIAKVICTYIGNNDDLHQAMAQKTVDVNVIPQGTFVERIRAAGSGIPAFYTPTGVGTVVQDGKEVREFNGRKYLLEEALHADFALIRVLKADAFGNVRFNKTARNFSPLMAMAAKTSIVECDSLVGIGEINPDDVHLPGIFVHRVLEVQSHEDPFEYKTSRKRV